MLFAIFNYRTSFLPPRGQGIGSCPFTFSAPYHYPQIAEEVLLHFAYRGIPALPVHDSFVIEEQHVDECGAVMRAAFHNRFGQDIPIDVTDLVSRANHILKGPVVARQSGQWKLMEDEIRAGIHDSDLGEGLEHGDP